MALCTSKCVVYRFIFPLKVVHYRSQSSALNLCRNDRRVGLQEQLQPSRSFDPQSTCPSQGCTRVPVVAIHSSFTIPSACSQGTCTNSWTTNLQFSFVNSELPEGDLRCQGHPWSSQQHTEMSRSYLETGRGKLISGVGETLNTISPDSTSERDPQTIQQPGCQSCSPPAEDQHRLGPNKKHLSLLRCNILWSRCAPGTEKLYLERLICAQTWARLFSLTPSPILLQWWHRWGVSCGMGITGALPSCSTTALLLSKDQQSCFPKSLFRWYVHMASVCNVYLPLVFLSGNAGVRMAQNIRIAVVISHYLD